MTILKFLHYLVFGDILIDSNIKDLTQKNVVALTRGYPNNLELYNTLIKRNNSIHKRINKLRKEPVDIVLFHEGNISKCIKKLYKFSIQR